MENDIEQLEDEKVTKCDNLVFMMQELLKDDTFFTPEDILAIAENMLNHIPTDRLIRTELGADFQYQVMELRKTIEKLEKADES